MTWGLGRFDDFFSAANDGRAPYRWQRRLAERVVSSGRWPEAIAVPTGAGKSSVVDIHVYAVAASVGTDIRPPRRMSVVVARRALVDSQLDRANRLRELLDESHRGVLAEVAARLRDLSGSGTALKVTSIRGGLPTDSSWIDDPRTVAVIAATPDMWGSRLLFRGYGTSRYARPREAGLLAIDSVMVLDEAHLNRQLLQTARDASLLIDQSVDQIGPISGLQVVATTATPDTGGVPYDHSQGATERVLSSDLDDDAMLHAALTTPKRVRVVTTADSSARGAASGRYVDLLAGQALDVAGQVDAAAPLPATVLCVVNTVDTAVHLAERLQRAAGTESVVCWVGRMRPMDLQRRRATHPGLFTVAGDASVRFLVATQTVEVGIDIDCAGLVTELAPGSALTQRFGRVNRRGLRSSAVIRVVAPEGAVEADRPPYGAADLQAARAWLDDLGADADVSPWALSETPAPAEATRRLVLSDLYVEHVEVLAQTSDPLFADFDLDFWLRDDLDDEQDSVGVVLRAGLPPDDNLALALLRVTPVAAREVFPTRRGPAVTLVQAVLAADESSRVFCWRGEELLQLTGDDRPHPGDHLVIDPVHSVTRQAVVVANPPATAETHETAWGEPNVRVALPEKDHAHWLTDLADLEPDEAQLVLDQAGGEWSGLQVVFPPAGLLDDRGQLPWLVFRPKREITADAELRQEWSRAAAPVTLDGHQAAVAERADRFARDLALDQHLVLALGQAGRRHDDGKADPPFQAMLHGDHRHQDLVLAKSTARTAQQTQRRKGGSGWRHEQLSVVLALQQLSESPERDVILWLVGTSHGRGRPFFPMDADSLLGGRYADEIQTGASSLFDTGAGWSDILDRVQHRFGAWGVAYLEAVLRAADCQVSSEGS